jgi:fibronectin type 3 domain-containing protein
MALLSVLIPGLASAQVITSGADFLRIDSGARSQGMGGAFTAVADDVNSLTWNPAGLGFLQNPEIGYLRMIYFSDVAYNFGGVALPLALGDNGLGLGAGVVNLGTTFDSTLGVAPAVTTSDNAFFLAAAYRVKNVFSFGITGKYILRQIAGYNASAFGGDAGILVSPVEHLRIGAGIFNVGQQVQFISAADPLPMTGRLGLAYQVLDIPHHSLVLSVDGSYLIDAQAYQAAAGFEYWLDKTFAARAGYAGDAYQQHWTAGLGLNVNIFQLDYAYAPGGTLGDTHRISFILRFGTGEGVAGLSAPSGFTANPLDGAVRLVWKAASSADVVGYNLYVKRPGNTAFAKLSGHPLSDTSVRLGHLQNGLNYSFAVASVSAAGRESSLTELSVVPGTGQTAPTGPALSAPTGLKGSLLGEGLQLSWDAAASADVAGFNLYLLGDAGTAPKKLTSEPVTETHVNLKKVDPEKTYRFNLTAVTKAGKESDPTAEVAVKWSDLSKAAVAPTLAKPGKVANFVVKAGNKMASLSWDEMEGAAGYNVYFSTDKRHFKKLNKDGVRKSPKAVLKPLKNGKKYYFGVSAVSEDGTEGPKVFRAVTPSRHARL